MPSLYKPTIITYTLPDGSYRTPDGKRITWTRPGTVPHESDAESPALLLT